ncbi:MAG: FtsW/RodA/SpoVE family cell cycle protein [Actinobacteria bacterium]|nr:FtsW/RodA/SpoVE family cell cycle protein [Actinomycetota bacterium]
MSATAVRRLRTGLGLLLLTIAVAVGAYVAVGLGLRGKVPGNVDIYGPLIAGGFLAVWLLARKVAPGADPVLLPIAGMLTGIGFALIFRLDAGLPPEAKLAQEQVTWLLVGLGAFALTLLIVRDDRQLDAFTYTIGLTGLALLLLPVVPGIGVTINGARLWVRFGPLSFQPSEFGKVLVVVFLASYLAAKRELLSQGVGRLGLPRIKDLGPLLLAWGTSLAVLFLEKDMGASLLYFAVFLVMVWVATGRPAYLLIGLVLFAIGAYIGYLAFSHVQLRVEYWLHALDPQHVYELGYGQIAQGQFALASGGLVGTGLGRGSPGLIPYAATDFIFAVIGEELGFLGTAALLMLYLGLVGRGLRLALERTDAFGKLLATGLTASVALQTFVIVGGVTRLIPLTGVTLPFVSYGGSSLVSNFVILALLVRVSAGPWERHG